MSTTETKTLHNREFGAEWSVAKKRADVFLQSLLTGNDRIAPVIQKAMDNPELNDHNHVHTDRVKRYTDFIISGLPQTSQRSIQPWLDSVALFAEFHDLDQLLALQRNIDENRLGSSELNVKKGHALGGALMILVLSNQYAEINHIPPNEARRICGGAALMMLRHDDIGAYSQALRGERQALPTDGLDDLYQSFKDGNLDLTSLSPMQLFGFIRKEKGEVNFPLDSTKIGLHPDFENGFQRRLDELSQDRSVLVRVEDESRAGLNGAAEIALAGDIIDMIIPPTVAQERTFSTQYSQNRPFFADDEASRLIKLIKEGDGNGNGKELPYDSDVYRILWQVYYLDNLLLKNSIFQDHDRLKNVLEVNTFNAIELLRHIGNHVMRGDFSIFDQFNNGSALKANFLTKPRKKGEPKQIDNSSPRVYSEKEIKHFNDICDQVYDLVLTQYDIPLVNIGDPLPQQGQTSTLHADLEDSARVLKLYKNDEQLWGFIPLGDELYRAELTAAEVANLGVLGQAVNAVARITRTNGDWRHDRVISMNKIPQKDFLIQRLKQNSATPTDLQNIADTVVDYQFVDKLCRPIQFKDGETMTTFLEALLLGGEFQDRLLPGEISILKSSLGNSPEQAHYHEVITDSLRRFSGVIEQRSRQYGEPVLGHGDIKIDNIAVVNDKPVILDIAPWIDWRINDRRMDAAFLYADLMINGQEGLAHAYWSEYDNEYKKRIGFDDLSPEEQQSTQLGINVLDAISLVYRYMILYRLEGKMSHGPDQEKARQYQPLATNAKRLLDDAVASLATLNAQNQQ